MNNPYIRQFPELMNGKTILYNHGFGSAASSGTVTLIRQTFPNARVIAYDLPLHPEEAMDMLRENVAREQPDLIIGTSMGGMYTEMLYGYDRILINPAFEMGKTMKEHGLTGMQTWHNPRRDGEKEFIVTRALEKEYRDMTQRCFTAMEAMPPAQKAEEHQRVWGLFGDEDKTVDTLDLFRSHYPQAVRFHGGHRLDDRSFMNGAVPVIRWIDDRREGRERPIVYIDGSTLKDSHGHPKASLQKAFALLCETYQVYIVFPAPSIGHSQIGENGRWVAHYLSTPAHDRVIYTNRKQLLYGDFLIDTRPCKDFLGTGIAFGSDSFKTWEEVITYFKRIG